MTDALRTAIRDFLRTEVLPALGPNPRAGVLRQAELQRRLDPHLAASGLPETRQELIRALLFLWHDHLDAAHTVAQGIEAADGSFVHAMMHRREPDPWNARYWWRRVGAHPTFPEIGRRAAAHLEATGESALARTLAPGGIWNPNAFVDACEAAMRQPPEAARVSVLRELQRIETEVLLEHLLGAS